MTIYPIQWLHTKKLDHVNSFPNKFKIYSFIQRKLFYNSSLNGTATDLSSASVATLRDFWCVDSSTTEGPTPDRKASFHLETQRHHLSPATRPGKCGRCGAVRSFPRALLNCRNCSVTCAHTVCTPWSRLSVLQYPSLYQPVIGS
jgi:hypothetical protein